MKRTKSTTCTKRAIQTHQRHETHETCERHKTDETHNTYELHKADEAHNMHRSHELHQRREKFEDFQKSRITQKPEHARFSHLSSLRTVFLLFFLVWPLFVPFSFVLVLSHSFWLRPVFFFHFYNYFAFSLVLSPSVSVCLICSLFV